jgi:cobalamin-dependent methionine synthase I
VPIPGLTIIGERINPGFRSTQALFDDEDFPGIQALAVRQAQAGASYLNVNAGTKALKDPTSWSKWSARSRPSSTCRCRSTAPTSRC